MSDKLADLANLVLKVILSAVVISVPLNSHSAKSVLPNLREIHEDDAFAWLRKYFACYVLQLLVIFTKLIQMSNKVCWSILNKLALVPFDVVTINVSESTG